MRLLLLLALGLLVFPACDTTTPPEEEEMEEELEPYIVMYVIDAPDDLADFAIHFTDEEGNQVLQPTESRLSFPVTRLLNPIPSDVAGTYRASINGFASEGAVSVRVEVTRGGLLLQLEEDSDQATGPDDNLSASAQVSVGG